jgi:hypothetical protein
MAPPHQRLHRPRQSGVESRLCRKAGRGHERSGGSEKTHGVSLFRSGDTEMSGSGGRRGSRLRGAADTRSGRAEVLSAGEATPGKPANDQRASDVDSQPAGSSAPTGVARNPRGTDSPRPRLAAVALASGCPHQRSDGPAGGGSLLPNATQLRRYRNGVSLVMSVALSARVRSVTVSHSGSSANWARR